MINVHYLRVRIMAFGGLDTYFVFCVSHNFFSPWFTQAFQSPLKFVSPMNMVPLPLNLVESCCWRHSYLCFSEWSDFSGLTVNAVSCLCCWFLCKTHCTNLVLIMFNSAWSQWTPLILLIIHSKIYVIKFPQLAKLLHPLIKTNKNPQFLNSLWWRTNACNISIPNHSQW